MTCGRPDTSKENIKTYVFFAYVVSQAAPGAKYGNIDDVIGDMPVFRTIQVLLVHPVATWEECMLPFDIINFVFYGKGSLPHMYTRHLRPICDAMVACGGAMSDCEHWYTLPSGGESDKTNCFVLRRDASSTGTGSCCCVARAKRVARSTTSTIMSVGRIRCTCL